MAINPRIKQKAEDIRKKIFGTEVRESLASGIEAISEDVEATKERQITVEETMQTVIDETTGKDVISAPEIIAAHVDSNGTAHPNLKSRLDNFEVSATQQLQQIEQLSYSVGADRLTVDNVTMTYADSEGYLIKWMDKDGVIYAVKGMSLYQSADNGTTYQLLYTFEQMPSGVRTLDDGELIVAIEKTSTIPSRVYKSSNGKTIFTLVLTTSSRDISIHGGWGMDVKGDNVVISEYGTYNKAIYAYLSRDGGNTFTTIFNLLDYVTSTASPHIHGIAYDEYFDRIWIAHGDNESNVYYTDDFGESWIKAYSHSQLLNIIVMEDCVLFGSDSTPNGIFRYSRGKKKDIALIELAYKVDDYEGITYIPYSTYRRDSKSPVIMTWMFMEALQQPTGRGFIVTTYDGREFQKVWQDSVDHQLSQSITAFAPTNDNKIIGTQSGDGRYVNATKIKGDFVSGYLKDSPQLSQEYKVQTKRPYIDAKTLGLKGNGANESRVLENALNYVADNHLTLVIPREMTITANNTTIEGKSDFKIICHGNIKIGITTVGSIANSLQFKNCSNFSIDEINFDGGNQTVKTQPLHKHLVFDGCENVTIGSISVNDLYGYLLTIVNTQNVTIDDIGGNGEDSGCSLLRLNSGNNIFIKRVVGYRVGAKALDNKTIWINASGDVSNVTISQVDLTSNHMNAICVLGGAFDVRNISMSLVNVQLLGETGYTGVDRIIDIRDSTNVKLDVKVDSMLTTKTGTGLWIDGVDGLFADVRLRNLNDGVSLGFTNSVKNSNIKIDIRDMNRDGVKIGKVDDLKLEGTVKNSKTYNINILPVNNLKNVVIRNSDLAKGEAGYRNINLYNANCTNVLFENNDMTGWANMAEKLEINLTGVTRINNRGVNYLNAKPNDSRYWNVGEVIYNTSPIAGGYLGWVCTVSGAPGTWKGFGLIES